MNSQDDEMYLQAKQLSTRSDTCRLLQGCQERSHQRFPLSDLLSVPIQRFLKYPLLMKVRIIFYHLDSSISSRNQELLKCTKKATVPNQADIKSLETVIALVEVSFICVFGIQSFLVTAGYCKIYQLIKRRLRKHETD